MDNPVPYEDYPDGPEACPHCGHAWQLSREDAARTQFHGYKGFGMLSNFAELSIACPSCGNEFRFDVNHVSATICLARMFSCRTCKRYFDHGLQERVVQKLALEKSTRTLICPNCGASNRRRFPSCLGVYQYNYTLRHDPVRKEAAVQRHMRRLEHQRNRP